MRSLDRPGPTSRTWMPSALLARSSFHNASRLASAMCCASGGLLLMSASREFRWTLFEKCRHAFAIVIRARGTDLQVAFEIELGVEIVGGGLVERLLDKS